MFFMRGFIRALVLLFLCGGVGGGIADAASQDDGGIGALIGRAEKQYKAGRLDDALAVLEEAAAAFPQSPRPLVAMATVLIDDQREREAVHRMRQAAELHRQHPNLSDSEVAEGEGFGIATRTGLLANLATWLYQTGDSGGATTVCEEAILVQPLHVRCYYIYGVSMLSSGRWREAGGARVTEGSLAAFARLSRADVDRANALFALGTLRLRVGHMAGAAAAFESARRLEPDRPEVLLRVGEMRSRFARHADALDTFQAAERVRPGHAEATIQCGNALRRLKRLAQALRKYKEAEGMPGASSWERAEALYWIGSVRELQGKKTKAEAAYRQALKREPEHARALNNLGSMLMARTDPGARALYERATRADPHMFEAYNNLGGLLLVDKDPHAALPLLEYAYGLDQSEPQLVFNLGLARRQAARAPPLPGHGGGGGRAGAVYDDETGVCLS